MDVRARFEVRAYVAYVHRREVFNGEHGRYLLNGPQPAAYWPAVVEEETHRRASAINELGVRDEHVK